MDEQPGRAGRYFVILGMMRTGSNFLERSIALHPMVRTYGELFNPSFIGGPQRPPIRGWDLATRDRDPLGLIETLIARNADQLIGFRLFDGHNDDVLRHCLMDPNCLRIILRRDPLESYVSLKIARETDQWMLNNPRNRLVARITFDPPEFEAHCRQVEAHYAVIDDTLAAAGQAGYSLDYPALNDPRTLDRLAHFLGLPEGEIGEAPIHRQNPEPLIEKVINGSDIAPYLKPQHQMDAAAQCEHRIEPANIVFARQARLAYLPLPGVSAALPLTMMHWFEKRDHGAAPQSTAALRDDVEVHFDTGLDAAEVASRLTSTCRFTMGQSVLARLYHLYYLQTLPGAHSLPKVRASLEERLGPTGSRAAYARTIDTEDGVAWHHDRFAAFLDLICDALTQKGPHPLHEGWRPVAPFLEAMLRGHGPIHILHADAFSPDDLVMAAGVAAVPAASAGRLARVVQPVWPMDVDRLPSDLCERVAHLFEPDVAQFGL